MTTLWQQDLDRAKGLQLGEKGFLAYWEPEGEAGMADIPALVTAAKEESFAASVDALRDTLTSTTLGKMLDEIADNLEGWDLYLIAAVCAEDGGRQGMAECLRWLARDHRRPRRVLGKDVWQWYNGIKDGYDPESDLPRRLYAWLCGGEEINEERSRIHYSSPRTALEAVFLAWPKAIAAGWRPE